MGFLSFSRFLMAGGAYLLKIGVLKAFQIMIVDCTARQIRLVEWQPRGTVLSEEDALSSLRERQGPHKELLYPNRYFPRRRLKIQTK